MFMLKQAIAIFEHLSNNGNGQIFKPCKPRNNNDNTEVISVIWKLYGQLLLDILNMWL